MMDVFFKERFACCKSTLKSEAFSARVVCVFLKEVLGLLYRMNTDLQHLYLYEIYHLNNATADLSRPK